MRLKTIFSAVLIILLIVAAFLIVYFGRPDIVRLFSQQPATETASVPAQPVAGMQSIHQDWLAFDAPTAVQGSGFDVTMTVPKPLASIEVTWTHPATQQTNDYVLQHYASGDPQAHYKIRALFGNLLPGINEYTVVGVLKSDQPDEQAKKLQVSFSLQWNLDQDQEIHPELMSITDLPQTVDQDNVEIAGTVQAALERIEVTSLSRKWDKSSFRLLTKFHHGDKAFRYFAKASYDNLYSGDNLYVIEGLDANGAVLTRKRVTLQSTKSTIEDQVADWFGQFTITKDGWYVSSKLPWFSLRPVYDLLWFQKDRSDDNVLMPRPSLLYTAQAAKGTAICDYLGSVDYHEAGVVYRGNAYEACHTYQFGVSLYDRFVSILSYKPFDVVRRIDYPSLTEKVSSAFLMIETGAMKEHEKKILTFDQMADLYQQDQDTKKKLADEAAANGDTIPEAKPGPRYYLYQFLIDDGVSYPGKDQPAVESQIPEDRKQLVADITAFLKVHSGDEIFTPLFFPIGQAPEASFDSATIDSTKIQKD